jgi:hypothetical protein
MDHTEVIEDSTDKTNEPVCYLPHYGVIKDCSISCWKHVVSEDYPTHFIYRGVNTSLLNTLQQWWHGPARLFTDHSCWPSGILYEEITVYIPEKRNDTTTI